MLWTKLGMGLLGMAGKGLAGSGLLQTLSQGLGSGKGGGSGKGMGCGRGGSLHGSGMKGSRSGKDGKGCRQTDAPALDELLTGLLQRQTTVGETVRTFLPAASPHEAGAETIDVQALPAGAAASTAVDNTDMEAAMRALLGSIHHFSDGRVRLRHPLFRESSTFGALHTLLCEGTGIRDATFNAVTCSALMQRHISPPVLSLPATSFRNSSSCLYPTTKNSCPILSSRSIVAYIFLILSIPPSVRLNGFFEKIA